MVVGYSLGNKDSEQEIQVLGENEKDTITYSSSLTMLLTRFCRNNCLYCSFHRNDNLTVPYSTIKQTKEARMQGIREVLYVAGERPDRFPEIRSTLDLWGFSSYLDYIYTVAELGFLEGLIPIIDVGFLSPLELKKMQEICGLVRVMLDGIDSKYSSKLYEKSPGKKMELRLKTLEWTGKLKFPTITGFMVGIGETKSFRKEMLKNIAGKHNKYGHIHEVLIHNFIPQPNTLLANKEPTPHKLMLETVELARELLPENISITIPVYLNDNIKDFIKAGVRDLGRIPDGKQNIFPYSTPFDFLKLQETIAALGFKLQQRFPLRFEYIKEGHYSKKLGQVFDAYKYKIKKNEQEQLKEIKNNPLK